MLKQNLRMRGVWLLLLVVMSVACTRPNPRSCADGVCSDPSFPFCDVDGSLEGIPDTCIAIECTPGAFEECRDDQALVCNDVGTSFDLVQCGLGCDDAAGGCVTCSSSDQCANPEPICDVEAGQCRTCVSDDECSSRVCDLDTGTCLAESAVVYAAGNGSGSGGCTLADPCSLQRAVEMTAGSLILRMLPGDYTTRLEMDTQRDEPISVVATGAKIISGGIFIHAGAKVDIRNLTVVTTDSISCGDTTNPLRSAVTIRNSQIELRSIASFNITKCSVLLVNCEVSNTASALFQLDSKTDFQADRLKILGDPDAPAVIAANGTEVSAKVTNSTIVNRGISLQNDDTATPGSQFLIAYNTFVYELDGVNDNILTCVGSNGARTVRFENNIILSTNAMEPLDPTSCTLVNNIVFPLAGSLSGNTIADPQLVDAANGNFHLQGTSPAKDSAVPSAVGLNVDHDFEGTARPQGPKADIGAFEFK
jgi:hypothetical protein